MMQNRPGNWIYISHGRSYESKEGFLKPFELLENGCDHWKHSLKRLREKTSKNIIIWNANESGGYWPLLHNYPDCVLELIHNYSHPDNKIWYVNGDAHAESNYNDWYELVKPKMRINMYPLVPSIALDIFTRRLKGLPSDHPLLGNFMPIHKKYRVISMINQPKISRILTLRELAGRPGFIYSFNCTQTNSVGTDGSSTSEDFDKFTESLGTFKSWKWKENGNAIELRGGIKEKGNIADSTYRVDLPCGFNMGNERFDQTKRVNFKTPFKGLEEDTDAYHDFLPVQEWLDSSIELINESYQVKAFGLSDKTCKVLGFCKPFLVIGCAGWYKTFKKLGFKLYDELFDYSFDEIESFRYRHEAIMTQIKGILNMDKDVLNKKLLDIQDKILYNKRQLLEYRDVEMNAFEMAKQIEETW